MYFWQTVKLQLGFLFCAICFYFIISSRQFAATELISCCASVLKWVQIEANTNTTKVNKPSVHFGKSVIYRGLLGTNEMHFSGKLRDSTPPTSDHILLMLRLIRVTKAGKCFLVYNIYLDYSAPRSMLVLGLSICVTMNVRLGLGLARLGASHPVLRGGSHLAPEWLTAGCKVGG